MKLKFLAVAATMAFAVVNVYKSKMADVAPFESLQALADGEGRWTVQAGTNEQTNLPTALVKYYYMTHQYGQSCTAMECWTCDGSEKTTCTIDLPYGTVSAKGNRTHKSY